MPSVARNNPVRPPIVNSATNPKANSMGVANEIDPLYSVAVQLKTLIADGTATKKLRLENTIAEYTDIPATNM